MPGLLGVGQQIYKTGSQTGLFTSPKKKFANTLQNTPATTQTTNVSTNSASGATNTQPVVQKPQYSPKPTLNTQVSTPQQSNVPAKTNYMNTMLGKPVEQTTPRNSYLEFMSSMFNPEQAQKAQQNIFDLNKRIEEENKRARREQEMLEKNEAGMLERGQTYEMSQAAQRAGTALSGLETARQTAMDIYNQMIDAGATVYEAEQAAQEAEREANQREAFNLSEGQARYDYNPETGQYEMIAQRGKTFAPSSGGVSIGGQTSSAAQAFAQQIRNGQATLANVPSAMRAEVAQALNQLPSQQVTELDNIINIIDELSSNPSLPNILGPVDQFVGGVFGQAATARNLYKQLEGILALSGRNALKGSGAISDFEFRVLKDAQSALGRNLNEEEFKKQLEKVRSALENRKSSLSSFGSTVSAEPTSNILVSPDGQSFDASDLTPEELQQALADGFTLQ